MSSIIELVLVLLSSFGFNMIPFAGPSNLFIASNAALLVPSANPLLLGLLVAIGASLAKSVHYMVTFFISKHLSEKRRKRLDADAEKVKKWAFLLLFVAAASPIPDEPIIIPLGLMKYSPTKFFSAYFLGKLSIAILGALLGNWTGELFSGLLSETTMIIISIALTIIVTVILLKVDLGKLVEKYLKQKPKVAESQDRSCSQ
jgi:membrane protein YqaA with SNARE-associated domain